MSATKPLAGMSVKVADLASHAGAHLGRTQWRSLDQEMVTRFADLTEDHNPIHLDPAFAASTPFGTTIVHGYFSLAMLAPLVDELLTVEGASVAINYGLDKVRFPAPLPVGARFRCAAELAEVKDLDSGVQLKVVATLELENSQKPALVAECLFRHYV